MSLKSNVAPFKDLTGAAVRIKVADVGANPIDGEPPYAGLLHAGDADVIGFEPNPAALERLNAKKTPFETYLPYAVGDGAEHILRFCQAPGMSSLFQPNPAVLNRFHGFPLWAEVLSEVPMQTVRFDDMPETAGVELLKMDIQGAELLVLQNSTTRLRDVLVIHTEVEFLQMYIGQPLFSEVEIFLRQQGFMFHRFFPTVSRTIRPLVVDGNEQGGFSQLLWADAIFVKDFTRLDELSEAQLLSTAKIMHDCYQSLDLVLCLLTAYDKRTNAELAPAYLAGLQNPAQAPRPK